MTSTTPLPTPPSTMDELVKQYVALRDKVKEAEEAHKAKIKPAKEYMEMLEGKFMEKLIADGTDSAKTPHGTVYRTTRKSATIADGQAFRAFVIEQGQFDLIDWKANAGAVGDFIKSNSMPPPGVNFSTAYTVGVRRA